MKNKIYKLALVFSVLLFTFACNEEEFKDDSTAVPSNPTLNVSLDFSNNTTLVETDADYGFTVTLSEPQIVDVVVYLTQTGGNATEGDDFSFPHSLRIPAGTTSLSGTISIHADDIIEDTETAVIKITTGVEANVSSISGETVTFNIENLEEGDLMIGLEWDMSKVTDNAGNEISPTDFADLRLLVSTSPNNIDLIGEADGGSFEHYTLSADEPDGDYYIVADFYDALDITNRDLNLTLSFDQVGVINGQTHEFAAALSNASICEANFFVLAKVTKAGDNYTFEEIGKKNFAVTSWSGTDVVDAFGEYDSKITSSIDCDGNYFLGINAVWMPEIWGETIIDEANVYYTVDGSGNITIPSQYIFTTLYSGAEYPYTISGSGTISGNMVTLEYNLDQDGFSPDDWMFDNGYMDQDYFIATVTSN